MERDPELEKLTVGLIELVAPNVDAAGVHCVLLVFKNNSMARASNVAEDAAVVSLLHEAWKREKEDLG